jgi:tRNA(fMet)-specific endonuclease VapC
VSVRYLLDTNVVSEPLRARPAPAILRRLRRHEAESAIPSIVWHELRFGCSRLPQSRRRDVIERYLDDVVLASFPILDYGRAAAEWHARQRVRLEEAGKPAPFIDGQIAAIAGVHDLILVTRDNAHFRGFEGLRVQRWG